MASLNIDLDYLHHPKIVRLIGRLGKVAEVLPIKLWIYCGKFHAEDGRLEGYLPREIEAQIEWKGKPGECVEAMVSVGLLDLLPGGVGYQVHDWLEHAGHIAVYKIRGQIGAAKRHGKVKQAELLQAQLQAQLEREPSTARAVQSSAVNTSSTDKPSKPKRAKPPHWADPYPAQLQLLEGAGGRAAVYSFLSKLAREQTEVAVLSALALSDGQKFANWKHAAGWLSKVAQSKKYQTQAEPAYEDDIT